MFSSKGCPDDGLLGRPSSEDEDAENASRFPCKVEYFKNKIITKVSAGEYHAQALTSDNELYTWGTYKDPGGYLGYAPGIHIQETPQFVSNQMFQGTHISIIVSLSLCLFFLFLFSFLVLIVSLSFLFLSSIVCLFPVNSYHSFQMTINNRTKNC
jgi:hypothetical protein